MKKATVLRLYVAVHKLTYVSELSPELWQLVVNDIMTEYKENPSYFLDDGTPSIDEYITRVHREYCCNLSDAIEYKYGEYPTVARYQQYVRRWQS